MQCHEFVEVYCTVMMSRYMQLRDTWTSHLIPTFEKVGEGGDTQSKRRKLAHLGVQICTFFFLSLFICFSSVCMHGASRYIRASYPMSHMP